MAHTTIYELISGRIFCVVSGTLRPHVPPGYGVFNGSFSGNTHYIHDDGETEPEPVPRPENPVVADKSSVTADGVEVLTLSNIPSGSVVRVHGPVASDTPVDDGTLELSTDTPGAYTVTVDSFPEQRKELTFDAT